MKRFLLLWAFVALTACRVERVGLNDVYPRSGRAAALLSAYGLDVADIVRAARRVTDKM